MSANKKLCWRIKKVGAHIQTLLWVGGDALHENTDLHDMLEEIDTDDLHTMFGEKVAIQFIDAEEGHDRYNVLINNGLYGFIAECYFHDVSDFTFDENGKPSSWRESSGVSSIFHAYAETPSKLVKVIEQQAREMFELKVAIWKEKKLVKEEDPDFPFETED